MKTIQHERYLFRQLKQKSDESVDSFYERLKHEIKKCGYKEDEEENRLKEQIIDKCTSSKLREIALQVDMSLEQLVFTGKTVEPSDKIKTVEPSRPYMHRSISHRDDRRECSRCGFHDHSYLDQNCPAFKGRCKVCNKRGHFEKMCWIVKHSRNRSRSRSVGDSRGKMSHSYESDCKPRLSRDSRKTSASYAYEYSYEKTEKPFEIKQEPKSHDDEKPDRSISQETVLNSLQMSSQETLTTNEPLAAKINEKVYDCLIGGMPSKLAVKSHYPTNVMSKDQFKKLYTGKYKFFTTDFVPSKVGDFTFSGQFTSKIEINNQIQYISFYVQEGSEEFVVIGKKMADQLGLKDL